MWSCNIVYRTYSRTCQVCSDTLLTRTINATRMVNDCSKHSPWTRYLGYLRRLSAGHLSERRPRTTRLQRMRNSLTFRTCKVPSTSCTLRVMPLPGSSTPRQRPATRRLPRPSRPSPRTLAQLPREVLQLHLNSRHLSVRHQLVPRLREAYRTRPREAYRTRPREDHEASMEAAPLQSPPARARSGPPAALRPRPPRQNRDRGRSPRSSRATQSSSRPSQLLTSHRATVQQRGHVSSSGSSSNSEESSPPRPSTDPAIGVHRQRSQHSSQRKRHSSTYPAVGIHRLRSQRSQHHSSQTSPRQQKWSGAPPHPTPWGRPFQGPSPLWGLRLLPAERASEHQW